MVDLNNLQINLIRSFRNQTLSQGGKTLDQLKQEKTLKQHQVEEIKQELELKDEKDRFFSEKQADIEEIIRKQEEEYQALERIIKDVESVVDAINGEANADQLKLKVKKLEEEIT